jgi:uncharacterized zinc-type alcohol dehydrogenase-like protein
MCHSDLHQVRNDWSHTLSTIYPCVPGHEIVGRVSRVGRAVTRFAVGDLAAVGCMVDSCRQCRPCKQGLEQYCESFATLTYNSPDVHSGGYTFGGYAAAIVVDEAFTLKLSKQLPLAAAAPLLCAGATMYSPLRLHGVGPGKTVGIVGLGGLGHMGVKLARALGAHVVLFTTSPRKREDALRHGAHEVVVSSEAAAMQKYRASLDLVIDTVAGVHDVNSYLGLVALDGALVQVGVPDQSVSVNVFNLLLPRRKLEGSFIASVAETQHLLDFCAANQIVCDVETIAIQQVDEAFARMQRADVRYRFVIDMASLKQ